MCLTRANLFIIHTKSRICFCMLGALHITSIDSLSRHMSLYSLYKVVYKIRQQLFLFAKKIVVLSLCFWVIIAD